MLRIGLTVCVAREFVVLQDLLDAKRRAAIARTF